MLEICPNRRKFLVSGISTILLSYMSDSWALTLLGRSTKGILSENSKFHLMDFFVEANAPIAVGQKYLEQYPDDANSSRLIKSIFGSGYPRDSKMLKISLSERISEDFRSGSIVFIDGWVLARTEGKICALTALLHDRNNVY